MDASARPAPSLRKLAVILHADVAGSTALVQAHESIAHTRIQDAFRRFASIIETYGGIAHEIRGDALVAEFSRVSDAVSAALKFQHQNQQFNQEIEDDIKPGMRIGISMGEVVVADKTLTGEGVVLAQRIEQQTVPGGVFIQGAARDILPGRMPYDCKFVEEKPLKGMVMPVRYYSVALKFGATFPDPEPHDIKIELESERISTSSIAVLPFDNLSGDPEQQYFTDGMTEDIITALSRFHDLHVTARNSAAVYRDTATDVREIGHDLGVHYVLEGSVRKLSDQVRVTVQLIDALSGNHLWAERYDRRLEDVFAMQDEITEMVASTLAIKVEAEVLASARRKNPNSQDAYDLVLRGDAEVKVFSREGSACAKDFYFKAIEIDPDCARAYVGIAFCYLSDWGYLSDSTLDTMDRAIHYARIAVELDDNYSRVHWVLAYVLTFNREFDEAEAHLQKALAMNPNDADVIAKMGYILPILGKSEEAIVLAERAVRLNPYHPDWYRTFQGFACFSARRYDDAINAFSRSGKMYYEDDAWKAAALAHKGQIDKAGNVMQSLLTSAGENPWWQGTFESGVKIEDDSTGLLTYMYHMYPFKNSADSEHLLEGLRKAGLPR
jgi:TolB-like protein/cytochrome c-type biogenesis protein CcmH/NrfG